MTLVVVMGKELVDILGCPELYYQLSGSEAAYNANFGTLVFQRLLRGNPKMFRLGGALEQFPKTLVLTDPTMLGWSGRKSHQVEKCLEILLHAGFEIYGLDKLGMSFKADQSASDLVPSGVEGNQNYLSVISRDPEEIILSTRELKNKPRSHIGFLDTHVINQLLGTAFEEYSISSSVEVDVNEVAKMQENGIDLELVDARLKKSHPDGMYYVIRDASELTKASSGLVEKKLSCEAEPRIQKIRLTQLEIIKRKKVLTANQSSPEGIELIIDDCGGLEKAQMKKIVDVKVKTLYFDHIDFKNFNLDLEQIKGVKALKFDHCENIEIILSKLERYYGDLEKLQIEGSNDLTAKTLANILSKMPKLEKLKLIKHEGTAFSDLPLYCKTLPKTVKVLWLLSTRVSEDSNAVIFRHEDNPRQYLDCDVTGCYIEDEDGKRRESSFKEMKIVNGSGIEAVSSSTIGKNNIKLIAAVTNGMRHLDLDGMEAVQENLGEILKNASDLNYLSLPFMMLFKLSDECRLDQLEELIMRGTQGSQEVFEDFLDHTSQLKEWTVEGINIGSLTQAAGKKLGHLVKFRGLKLHDINLLFDVMKHAAGLKEIEVSGLYGRLNQKDRIVSCAPFTAPSVEKMKLALEMLEGKEVSVLLDAVVNLKRLEISSNGPNYPGFGFGPNALKHLEHLTLSTSDASLIPSFLRQATSLKEFVFVLKGSTLVGNRLKAGEKYPTLEKIAITKDSGEGGGVFEEFIYNLIEGAPNLKFLQFNGICYTRQRTEQKLPDNLRFDELEILDISDGDFLTKEGLYNLLLRAPKLRELRIFNRSDLHDLVLPPGLKNLKLIISDEGSLDAANKDEIQDQVKSGLVVLPEYIREEEEEKRVVKKKQEKPRVNPPAYLNNPDADMDVDTEMKESTYTVSSLFRNKKDKMIDPSTYRIFPINTVMKKEGKFARKKSPFISKNIGDPLLRDCPEINFSDKSLGAVFDSLQEKEDESLYHAKMRLELSTVPQVLPSISSHEIISHFSIAGLDKKEYKIEYSERDNLYYIHLLQGKNKKVSVEYILSTPKNLPQPSQSLQQIIDEYRNSKITELPETMQEGDADYWIKNLIETRGGACRHKVIGFYYEMEKKVFKRRLMGSIDHVIVEVQEKEGSPWVTCDLGGYPVHVNLSSGLFTEKSPRSATSSLANETPKPKRELGLNPAFIDAPRDNIKSPKAYAFDVLSQHSGENLLIDLQNNQSVDALQKLLRQVARDTHRPVFYIDSPDDIRCHAPRLIRETGLSGKMLEGKGGDLYEFLTNHHTEHPVLIVNWNNFTAEEIVRFNSLFDRVDRRKADKIAIPKDTTVLGLYNSHRADAYKGSDFTSRSDNYFAPTFSTADIVNDCEEMPEPSDKTRFKDVNLHKSDDWQNLLFGQWMLSPDGWFFKEGPLIEAIESGQSLMLHDPPWFDRDFQNFVDRLRIEKSVEVGGKKYKIPEGFVIQEGATYPIEKYAADRVRIQSLHSLSALPAGMQVLNPLTFNDFFHRYQIQNNKICTSPGLIDAAPTDVTWQVYLSHPLTDAQWGRLIDKLGDHLTLEIFAHDDIKIPDALKQCKKSTPVGFNLQHPRMLEVMECDPHDAMIEGINIDCTDMTVADLFENKIKMIGGGPFDFEYVPGAVTRALYGEKPVNVVLTGTPSEELLQYLTQWGSTAPYSEAHLVLLTPKPLPALFPVSVYGKYQLPRLPRVESPTFVETPSVNLVKGRSNLLHAGMDASPITVIEGPTGSGKTTTILDHFRKEPGIDLHVGLDRIPVWRTPAKPGETKVLYIDEANITEERKREWTEFAGMILNNPPQTVYNGDNVILSDRHKIIFAKNPENYGDRHAASLFKNYPVSRVQFNALSREFILDSVLKPILGDLPQVNQVFMQMYDKLIQMGGSEIWITPREVEHMAHLYLIHKDAEQCAYLVAKQVVPQDKQHLLKAPENKLFLRTAAEFKGHVITKSRRSAESRLNEFLAIREQKQANKIKGGLGGLILEGDPGTGKSEQVIAQLVAHGLEENQDFYHITFNQSYSEQKELLTKAFNEGAIVLIDEINTYPAMERFFNDALSGRLEGEEGKPGFLLIGTQNPASFEGRRELSPAMRRRLFIEKLPPYPFDEMVEVLVKGHGVDEPIAREIVYDFTQQPLSFRTLIKKYEQAIPYIIETLKERSVDLTQEQFRALFESLVKRQGAGKDKLESLDKTHIMSELYKTPQNTIPVQPQPDALKNIK